MRRGFLISIGVVFLLCLGLASAWCEPVVNEMYYQKNTPLAYPATYNFRFSLWDQESEGIEVWSEKKPIKLTTAVVKTYLGDTEPLDGVDFSQQLWVQVERKTKTGTYKVIGSMERLGVVPYASWALSPAGPTGPTGPQGPIGLTGATGLQGEAGPVGLTGATGSQGEAGPAGAEGPQGPAGISGLEVLSAPSGSNSTSPKTQGTSCSGTQKALGGGGFVTNGGSDVAIQSSYPIGGNPPTGWMVTAVETDDTFGSWSVTAYVICATVEE